jgi:hypothetical protein
MGILELTQGRWRSLAGDVELDSEGLVEALDLARCGRRARRDKKVVDTVLATNAVEEHLDRGLGEAPGEDLAVVGQDLGRHPIGLQS